MPFLRKRFGYILCALLFAGTSQVYAQVANFTHNSSNKTKDCPPFVVNFVNTSTNATTYAWTVKLGASTVATSVLTNPSFSFTAPGNYDIILTATNSSGSNTFT